MRPGQRRGHNSCAETVDIESYADSCALLVYILQKEAVMPVQFSLTDNPLTPDPNDKKATTQPTGTIGVDELVDRIIDQGSTVNKADIQGVFTGFSHALGNALLEGLNVITPWANFKTGVKGVFNGVGDTFDRSRHQVCVNVSPGAELRNLVKSQATATKVEAVKPAPNLIDFTDLNSGERNSLLTPNGMGRVLGYRLKYEHNDPQQGVFFVAADNTETRVEVVGTNKPSEMIFLIPALATGEYILQARASFGTEDIRTGSLDDVLTVS